jgi:hypothetical protein
MIITLQTARRAIRAGTAREIGTVVSDGWRWLVVERLDYRRIDHVMIDRTLDSFASGDWGCGL